MPPWIARALLILIAVEAGVCGAFLADEWRPLRQGEEGLFRRALAAMHEGHDFVVDTAADAGRLRISRPLEVGETQPILRIDVDEDPERLFETYPLSPVDWTIILKNARDLGCRVAAIEPPLTWDRAEELPLRALDRSLADFEKAVLTVDLRRAPVGQTLPAWLHRSGIPAANVHGSLRHIPRMNRVVLPPSATGAPNALFSFRILEGEFAEAEDAAASLVEAHLLPALAVWDNYLIPSFPLAVAMALEGVPPHDVHVYPGEHVRLGTAGPIVSIDEFGRFTFPLVEEPEFSSATAGSLIVPDAIAAEMPRGAARMVLFADAAANNPSPWKQPSRLQRIVSTFDTLPTPQDPQRHPRFAPWGETLCLALIAAMAALTLRLSRWLRPLAFTGLFALALAILGAIFYFQHAWMPVAPVLLTALTGMLLAPRLARHLPPRMGPDPET